MPSDDFRGEMRSKLVGAVLDEDGDDTVDGLLSCLTLARLAESTLSAAEDAFPAIHGRARDSASSDGLTLGDDPGRGEDDAEAPAAAAACCWKLRRLLCTRPTGAAGSECPLAA